MRLKGEVKDIFDIYDRFRNSLSNRDLRWYNETTSKVLFAMLVQMDGVYLIETERELSGGYADIYLRENVKYKDAIKYNYLIEFKHIKSNNLKGDLLNDSHQEISPLYHIYLKCPKKTPSVVFDLGGEVHGDIK